MGRQAEVLEVAGLKADDLRANYLLLEAAGLVSLQHHQLRLIRAETPPARLKKTKSWFIPPLLSRLGAD